jgi:hypothetical protein
MPGPTQGPGPGANAGMPTGSFTSGSGQVNTGSQYKSRPPAWWQKFKKRWDETFGDYGPMGIGGGNAPVPVVPASQPIPNVGASGFNANLGGTGSFVSGSGLVNTGGQWGAPPPSGSFLSGSGQVNMGGQTQQPVFATPPPVYADPTGGRGNNRNQRLPLMPTGTFFGAGGEAVRGPDAILPPAQPPTLPPPSSGFSTRYKGWGRGGGGYGGGGGGGYERYPSWLMGLYSWNFKG